MKSLFNCDLCEHTFPTKSDFLNHAKVKHNISNLSSKHPQDDFELNDITEKELIEALDDGDMEFLIAEHFSQKKSISSQTISDKQPTKSNSVSQLE